MMSLLKNNLSYACDFYYPFWLSDFSQLPMSQEKSIIKYAHKSIMSIFCIGFESCLAQKQIWVCILRGNMGT